MLGEHRVGRRDRVHIPAHDPAHDDRLCPSPPQQLRDETELQRASLRAGGERLEVRVDHPQHARVRLRPTEQHVRHQRVPAHLALPEMDAHGRDDHQAPRDERDRPVPVPRALGPALFRATRRDHEPSLDPRVREQCGECMPPDLLQEDQAWRGLASIVLWECVKLEVVQRRSEALIAVVLLGIDVPCNQSY